MVAFPLEKAPIPLISKGLEWGVMRVVMASGEHSLSP